MSSAPPRKRVRRELDLKQKVDMIKDARVKPKPTFLLNIKCSQLKRNSYQLSKCMYNRSMIYILYLRVNLSIINWIKMDYMPFLCYIYLAIEVRNIYTHLLCTKLFIMYNYSISKKHVNMIEIILARSNQLVIQLNSLASVPTPLGRTCINRRSVQNGHSTLSPGNPEWPELTVYFECLF